MPELQEDPSQSTKPEIETPRERRKFILCFDGTGNKFQGTPGDSNSKLLDQFIKIKLMLVVLKIYSMLERTDKSQCKYCLSVIRGIY